MLTERQSTLWTEEGWGFQDTYVNNRRTEGWTYDNDGNTTYAAQINYQYDSASRMIKTDRNEAYEMTVAHDGAGREAKRSQRKWDGEEDEWEAWETNYFVFSSVMGRTLTEVSQTGTKKRTFVVAAGTVMARQFVDDEQEEAVSWEYADASGHSIRMIAADGTPEGADKGGGELDPLGNNVGTHGSLIDPRNYEGEISPANRSPISSESLCNRDGLSGPCHLVNFWLRGVSIASSGSALPIEMTGTGLSGMPDRSPFYNAFYRNSLQIEEDEGRWIQTDWDVTYEENLSGTNDSSVTIIGRVNAMTFIPPSSLSSANSSPPVSGSSDCEKFASKADELAKKHQLHLERSGSLSSNVQRFMDDLVKWGTEFSGATSAAVALVASGAQKPGSYQEFGHSGFKELFHDSISPNQVRHSIGGLLAGYINILGNNRWSKWFMNEFREAKNVEGMSAQRKAEVIRGKNADRALNNYTMRVGARIADSSNGYIAALALGDWIRENLCTSGPRAGGGRSN